MRQSYTYVQPKLEFASVIWLPSSMTQGYMLGKNLNKFLRYLYYRKYKIYPDFRTVGTVNRGQEFNIMNLKSGRDYHVNVFVNKIFNNLVNDNWILSIFNLKVSSRLIRPNSIFQIPFTHFNCCLAISNYDYYYEWAHLCCWFRNF